MRFPHRSSLPVLIAVTVLIVAGMLYFGLRLKAYRPENNVEWLPAGQGAYFKRSAMAFTPDFFRSGREGLTIEMVVRCEELDYAGFRYILSVHDGRDDHQLLVGQWRHWLMVMNGDDYDGRQGIQKLYVDLGADHDGPVWVTVVSGPDGTRVCMDGRWAKSNANLRLAYPHEGRPVRLVVGNSVYARHAWQGVMVGLGMYDRALDDETVVARASAGGQGGFALDRQLDPRIFYRFDGPVAGRVINLAQDRFHLEVPERLKMLQKEYLRLPFTGGAGWWATLQDALLNLVGFAPLGFMLCAIAHRFERWRRWRGWLAAVGAAFAFSLALELAQAWMPTRDSSLLDLMMNTVGAGLGGLGFHLSGTG